MIGNGPDNTLNATSIEHYHTALAELPSRCCTALSFTTRIAAWRYCVRLGSYCFRMSRRGLACALECLDGCSRCGYHEATRASNSTARRVPLSLVNKPSMERPYKQLVSCISSPGNY